MFAARTLQSVSQWSRNAMCQWETASSRCGHKSKAKECFEGKDRSLYIRIANLLYSGNWH